MKICDLCKREADALESLKVMYQERHGIDEICCNCLNAINVALNEFRKTLRKHQGEAEHDVVKAVIAALRETHHVPRG